MLIFPSFSSLSHAPILERDGAAFNASSQADFQHVGVLLVDCNKKKGLQDVVTFPKNFCLAQIKTCYRKPAKISRKRRNPGILALQLPIEKRLSSYQDNAALALLPAW